MVVQSKEQLELLISQLKGLSSMTDYTKVMHDQYYAMLCSHYTTLGGG